MVLMIIIIIIIIMIILIINDYCKNERYYPVSIKVI